MNKKFINLLLSAIFLCVADIALSQIPKQKKYLINGYVGGFRGLVNTAQIDAKNSRILIMLLSM